MDVGWLVAINNRRGVLQLIEELFSMSSCHLIAELDAL